MVGAAGMWLAQIRLLHFGFDAAVASELSGPVLTKLLLMNGNLKKD